jgi:hypothetical protein
MMFFLIKELSLKMLLGMMTTCHFNLVKNS